MKAAPTTLGQALEDLVTLLKEAKVQRVDSQFGNYKITAYTLGQSGVIRIDLKEQK